MTQILPPTLPQYQLTKYYKALSINNQLMHPFQTFKYKHHQVKLVVKVHSSKIKNSEVGQEGITRLKS